MSDEQWLREGLADAVPPPPTNPERARAAERLARRRRRTTSLAVLGTAGAVAAAAVLTATLTSGGDDGKRDDQVASDPPPPVECPPIKVRDGTAEGSAIDQPDPDAPGAVPEGATSARLCQGPGTTFEVPDDALVDDVDGLVAEINALPETGEPEVCTMDLGPGFRIAFGYDDGSTFVVSGQLYGCRTLVVGSGYRANPELAHAQVLALLDEQDGETGPEAADLTCNIPVSPPVPAVADISEAILCTHDGRRPLSSAIDAADLDLLLGDIATHQTTGTLRCAAAAPYPWINGVDATGRRITIPSECAVDFWRLPNGKAWTPSAEATAILDRLVSEAR